MHIATTATAAYDDSVTVMVQSFLAHHPGSTCWLFMPDDPDGIERRLADQFCRRVTIADLPIDGAEFARQATIYRPDELAQSSKPLVLQAVLDQIDEPCAYLDADIEVYGALDALPGLLGDAELALTPHWSGHRAPPRRPSTTGCSCNRGRSTPGSWSSAPVGARSSTGGSSAAGATPSTTRTITCWWTSAGSTSPRRSSRAG